MKKGRGTSGFPPRLTPFMAERPLSDYVAHTDELAQKVMKEHGEHSRAGTANSLPPDFKALFELALQYQVATKIADKLEAGNPSVEEIDRGMAACKAFCIAFKARAETP